MTRLTLPPTNPAPKGSVPPPSTSRLDLTLALAGMWRDPRRGLDTRALAAELSTKPTV